MTHRDLDVYKESIEFVVDIYRLIKTFPRHEIYSLSSQMQRAAVSIPSNIAEGATRSGTKEYIHFLYIAAGSASELETQIKIAARLGYIHDKAIEDGLNTQIDRIRMKILKLVKNLEQKLITH